MKLSNLLSDVLDGQKLIDNGPDEKKTQEVKSEPAKEESKTTTKKTKKAQPELPVDSIDKQKHDEEIAAKIKAKIKPTTTKSEPASKTMNVPNFAKLREMAKQQTTKQPVTTITPPSVTPPPEPSTVEQTTAKTDTPKT